MYELILENFSPGLGDSLTFTPIYRLGKKTKMLLPDTDQARRISPIYDNIFDVEFKDSVGYYPTHQGHDHLHIAKARLAKLNAEHISGVPIVKLNDSEVNRGLSLIKHIANPVAIVANPSDRSPLTGIVNNETLNRKVSNKELWNRVYNLLVDNGYTPIQFGLSRNIDLIHPNVVTMLDLNIRDLSSVYYNIKRYIGVDTGDYHLMLAVGGKVAVFLPELMDSGIIYPSWQWQYHPKEFHDGLVRSRYISKNVDVNKLMLHHIIY